MMRQITSINLSFTTHCNMQCPDCCCNITYKTKAEKSFYGWDYFVNAAQYFHSIDRIHLTGGEPTTHPKFTCYVPLLKDLFACNLLTLETNGTNFKRFPDIFKHFDKIYITHYTEDTFKDSPDNTEAIEFIKDYLIDSKVEIIVGNVIHTKRETRSGGNMCSRGYSETVAYCDGVIYPCCVAPGLHTKVFIEPSLDWKDRIQNVHPPCEECFFSVT